MATWEKALEEQVKLLRFWRGPVGQRYADSFAADVESKLRAGGDLYRGFPEFESARLERCAPVYVDEHVMDLLMAAVATVRPEPLLPADLFADEGFAYLPRPYVLIDTNGKRASFRAFSWGPRESRDERGLEQRLAVALYTDWRDEDDYNVDGVRDGLRWRDAFGGDLSLFHVANLTWGMAPDWNLEVSNPDPSKELRATWESHVQFYKFIQTFFRLAEQRVTIRTHAQGDRHARKRMRRLKSDNNGVLVVTLRRPRTPREHDEVHDVPWQYQWVVGGHWRNQFYPTLGEHRQIWIAPYVKGPGDKPLMVHPGRAYEFKR